jgi:hypothetical protein
MKKKKKVSEHYVDNKVFYEELCKWKQTVVEADECGEKRPPVTNYIGSCFIKIAEGLSRKLCFINYDFRDDMIGDAIENCTLYAHNFSPTKSKNPFAYFTQMTYYAFLRRIQKEKKQMYVKYKLAEQSPDFKNFMKWDDKDPHERLSLNETFKVTEKDISNFSPNKSKKKSNKKKGTLEDILPEEED